MFGKLGRFAKKAGDWIGKAEKSIVKVGKGAVTGLERGNEWVGKALKSVKKEYGKVKGGLIDATPDFLRPAVRQGIDALEKDNPFGLAVSGAFSKATLAQQQASDILESPAVRSFRNR